MSINHRYPLKGFQGLPDKIGVPFKKLLKPELLCTTCNAVTPQGRKDGKGHNFCQECIGVHTDNLNEFTCSLCEWHGHVNDMVENTEEWNLLGEIPAACLHQDKGCPFQGPFKDVLRHYHSCSFKEKVACTLCGDLIERKRLASHVHTDCPKRILMCDYCRRDIEAWEKGSHESSCPERPASCEYCKKHFNTYLQLEEEHYPVCSLKPVTCSFQELGCSFQAPRHQMAHHEKNTAHTEILVGHISRLTAENQRLLKWIDEREKIFQKKISDMEEKMARLQEETDIAFNHRIRLDEALKKQEGELQAQKNHQLRDRRDLEARLDETERFVTILQHDLRLGPLQAVFEHVWKLQPYSSLRHAYSTPGSGVLSSGVLCVNTPGYRMELVADVCRPAPGSVQALHLGLKMRIHPGEHDGLLPWPFAHRIRLVLVNQFDDAESRRFELDTSTAHHARDCLKKPAENAPNPMFGYSQVIPIPLLENEKKGFLVHNCVVVKLIVFTAD